MNAISKIGLSLLSAGALVVLQASTIDAQVSRGPVKDGPVVKGIGAPVRGVANTAWAGVEDLSGAPTKLGFAFRGDGKCVMIDQMSPGEVKGSYHQEGDQVTIEFANCVYRGRLEGNRLSGSAEFTQGERLTWNFSVEFLPPRK
ncbi:MAG: hypothetical protein U0793_12395 [Gemmataceae bacterium]